MVLNFLGWLGVEVLNSFKHNIMRPKLPISTERYMRIILLARMANEMDALPDYEPNEEEIDELCSAIGAIKEMDITMMPMKMQKCVPN